MKTSNELKFIPTNLKYTVDTDFDYTPCTCGEYPCRCTHIINTRVSVPSAQQVINQMMENPNITRYFHDDVNRELERYCLNRLFTLAKVYDANNYTVYTCSGYYGEEIESVEFDREEEVIREYLDNIYDSKSAIASIKYILQKEYGYLLDGLEKIMCIETGIADKKLISVGRADHYEKLEPDVIKSYEDDYDWTLPCCIVTSNGFDKNYRLIDGYHRLKAWKKDKVRIMNLIVLDGEPEVEERTQHADCKECTHFRYDLEKGNCWCTKRMKNCNQCASFSQSNKRVKE